MFQILVTDDDADVREAVRRYLEISGFRVECAKDGLEALKRILRNMPDLLLLDLTMPELDGCGLLEILRSYKRFQTLPVVLLTGVSEGPLIDRAREYQVNEILQKGKVTLDEIVGAARKVLGRGQVRPPP